MVSMDFVWDESKAELNLRKHGVSFQEASTVFEDYDALQIYDPDHSEEEDRFIMLGMSSALRILVVCHCYRENEGQIRIISARKATRKETATYNGRK
ncbi:MAG: BrnT family toxin [Lentisphaeria bacterium]|nr:BrnT family toxin [Lentisphaeria bacterium]